MNGRHHFSHDLNTNEKGPHILSLLKTNSSALFLTFISAEGKEKGLRFCYGQVLDKHYGPNIEYLFLLQTGDNRSDKTKGHN